MSQINLIEYLCTLCNSMKSDGAQTVQLSDDTLNLILSELIDNRDKIEHLQNSIMSEDQVKKIMQDTCHEMMKQQSRIFEINGALEAITQLEAECNDAKTLHSMFALAMHYKKLLKDFE